MELTFDIEFLLHFDERFGFVSNTFVGLGIKKKKKLMFVSISTHTEIETNIIFDKSIYFSHS